MSDEDWRKPSPERIEALRRIRTERRERLTAMEKVVGKRKPVALGDGVVSYEYDAEQQEKIKQFEAEWAAQKNQQE